MIDVALRNATILDGTGCPGNVGDIGLEVDRIASVGGVASDAREEIDASGLVASPGFIDIHVHSDYTLLVDGRAGSALFQGVTTHVCGNCGISPFPMGDRGPYQGPFESARLQSLIRPDWTSAAGYFQALEERGIGLNAAFFTGHGAVRDCAMGESAEPPTRGQMGEMKGLVEKQMEEGSLGLSTGLTYVPGSFASTEEIIELTAAIAPYGGIYATHMRNYTASIMEALEEAIRIGREANVPVHASHITPCPPATGSASDLLDRIERARREGQDVTAETEFYATGSTALKALLPPWVLVGGAGRIIDRLQDTLLRQQMWREIQEQGSELGGSTKTVLMQNGKWEKLWLGNCEQNLDLIGRTFGEIGRQREKHPFEAICDILVEEEGRVSFFGEDKSEEDIDVLAKGAHCGLGSDGFALSNDGPLAQEREHPRCYGGIAYLVRTLVRERNVLTLERLVQRVTQFPAERMGFTDRGVLANGNRADVVLFDPDQMSDHATIEEPNRYSNGVSWLFVNGTPAIREGRLTGALPGKVLRGGPMAA